MKAWESGGLSAAQTTSGQLHQERISVKEASHCLHRAQWDAFMSAGLLGGRRSSNLRWPIGWNQQTAYCLSYLQLSSASTFSMASENKQDPGYLFHVLPWGGREEGLRGGLGVRDVTIPHPCAYGPPVTHGILCRRLGGPPQHNVPVTRRLGSQVQMCDQTNTGEGLCLGESEDGNCPAGVSDVWRVGRVARRLGFIVRGDNDESQCLKMCEVLRTHPFK